MMERLLICTDLDRTLLPNGAQPESTDARVYFKQLAECPGVTLAYVSGRHRDLVKNAIAEYQLPLPDFVVGDVGTTIYHLSSEQEWTLQTEWASEIAKDWGGKNHADVIALLTDFEPLRLQEPSKQSHYKVSYYAPLKIDYKPMLAAIRERLSATGIRASLVWSIDEPAETGLLDVLPERATKYHAVKALMKHADFSLENTIFCGDSGNDIEVLVSSVAGVLVANSHADVQKLARELADANGQADRLYLAQGDFMGMNGHYASGILEGIVHYYPCVLNWMGLERSTGGKV